MGEKFNNQGESGRESGLYSGLFGSEESPPEERETLRQHLERRSTKKRMRNPRSIHEAIGRRRRRGDNEGTDVSMADLARTYEAEFLTEDELRGMADCEQLDLPPFSGLGGRRGPHYPIEMEFVSTQVSGRARAMATSPALYASVKAGGTSNDGAEGKDVRASAYLGFWIQPRQDVPFHEIVVTAYIDADLKTWASGASARSKASVTLEVGTVAAPSPHLRPGYANTASLERFVSGEASNMPIDEQATREKNELRLTDPLILRFRAKPFVYHYVLFGVRAEAESEWDTEINLPGPGGMLGGTSDEPRRPQQLAEASVTAAVCAIDVEYKPLTLLEEMERRRHERLRDELRAALADLVG